MKIGELAGAAGVSVDTVRYYEKQGLLDPPHRAANGYRSYVAAHLERVRFVRSARALGFTLTEIAAVIPRLMNGQFGRAEIERELDKKIGEIDAQIGTLQALKRDLRGTAEALRCSLDRAVPIADATLEAPGAPVRIKQLRR
jgi:MerR family copper efflux transcriptional regulator